MQWEWLMIILFLKVSGLRTSVLNEATDSWRAAVADSGAQARRSINQVLLLDGTGGELKAIRRIPDLPDHSRFVTAHVVVEHS